MLQLGENLARKLDMIMHGNLLALKSYWKSCLKQCFVLGIGERAGLSCPLIKPWCLWTIMIIREATALVELLFWHSGTLGKIFCSRMTTIRTVNDILTKSVFYRLYKIASGLMLAHPYGVTRVMSSYHWDRNLVNGKVNT